MKHIVEGLQDAIAMVPNFAFCRFRRIQELRFFADNEESETIEITASSEDYDINFRITMIFKGVVGFCISDFGGGHTRVIGFDVMDIQDRQLQDIRFQVVDFENKQIEFYAREARIARVVPIERERDKEGT